MRDGLLVSRSPLCIFCHVSEKEREQTCCEMIEGEYECD